jgi:N6-adenosine-specific RNA methylase IME4
MILLSVTLPQMWLETYYVRKRDMCTIPGRLDVVHDLRFTVTERYPVLLLDPPWSYYGSQVKMGAAAKFYPTMTDEQIAAIPVLDWVEQKHVVFVWTTGPRLDTTLDVVRAWGLQHRGIAFVWVKTRKDGVTPIGAQGVRPSVVKPTTEFVIAASAKKKGRPLPIADEGVRQVVLAAKGKHSAKPDIVQDRIENLYPNLRKAEMFARRQRPGWDCYSDT